MQPLLARRSFRTVAACAVAALAVVFAATAQETDGPKAKGMNPGETVRDAAVPQNRAMDKVPDVPGLPRVLLIGDSISLGYTVAVRELLKGKANVHRPPRNCGSSTMGIAGTSPDAKVNWLEKGNWDVIHFNHGIWDAKLDLKTGLPVTSDAQYIQNLETIADRCKATGATVIFATTTPIPDNLLAKETGKPLPPKTRLFINIIDRNQQAVAAMEKKGVLIDDLYAAIYPEREKYWRPRDLHYSKEGSQVLAQAVAASILKALEKK